MKTILLGYRVTGISPETEGMARDDFTLRQAAVECARLLIAQGWTSVECSTVTQVVDDYFDYEADEELMPIDLARAPAFSVP